MRKLLVLVGLGALGYWLVKDRLAGEPDEFVFTESPPIDSPDEADSSPPPAA